MRQLGLKIKGKGNLAQMGKTGGRAAALDRISHPGILHHLPSPFPAAWSYKQCIITYQQTNQVSSHNFRVQRTGFWLCVFCGDQQHATHPSAAKLYTCLMITHMYDEKDDLDMFNVFFNEPVPLSRWGRRRIINPFAPAPQTCRQK